MGGAGSALLALTVLITLAVVGAPIALGISGVRREWWGLAFDAILVGLVIEQVIALVSIHLRIYTLLNATLITVGVMAVSAFLLRDGIRAALARTHFAVPKRITLGIGAGIATIAIVALGLWLRRGPSYFIFQTGLMGSFVNSANSLTVKGSRFGTYPHGFTVYLGATKLLLGRAHTVAGLPALGIMLLIGAIAYMRTARLRTAAVLGVALIIAVHPITVWFSLFPVAEVLGAPLVIAALYLALKMRTERSHGHAVLGGLAVGLALLARGETLLLAPIVVAALWLSAAIDDDETIRVQRTFTVAALVSLLVAYGYDIHFTHPYFNQQLGYIFPHSVFRFVRDAHLIQISVASVLVGVVGLAATLGIAVLVKRHVRPRVASHEITFARIAAAVIILGTALALVALGTVAGLEDALWRWGIVLLILCGLGIVALSVNPGRYVDHVSGLFLLLVFFSQIVLFARRVKVTQPQAFYLYFDRYLFSVALPAGLLLGAIGLHVAIGAVERATVARPRRAQIAVATVLVVALLALIPQINEMRRVTRYPLFGNSYHALSRLNTLTLANGPKTIVYSGNPIRPPSWFFPNTYRPFALPLEQSFNRTVIGVPLTLVKREKGVQAQPKAYARDRPFNPQGARSLLAIIHQDSGYLIELRRPGVGQFPDDAHTKYLGTVKYRCPTLGQTAHGPAAPWKIAEFRFDVYAIS